MKFKAGYFIDYDDKEEQSYNEPYLVLQIKDGLVYYYPVNRPKEHDIIHSSSKKIFNKWVRV